VARVNPNYPEPPGTPDQLAAIQDEIANLLGARAQAEQSEAAMAAQEQQHQVNQEHAAQAVQSTAGALTATQAHQQAVARRTQANQQQQQRQQESQGLVSGYPSRAAGVAAVRIPLAAFQGFLYIATELPGDAGAAMQQMADDANRMDQAFTQMDLSMEQQADAQPARQQELQGDQSRLETTDQQAQTSQDTLQQASEGAQTFQQENDQRLQQATQGREEAAQQKGELDEAVDAKQQQAETFAQELQGWAGEHQAARQTAIQATSQQIEEQGYVVREVAEA
jgi:hypothetical protein